MGKKWASLVKRLSDLWSVQCRKDTQELRFFLGVFYSEVLFVALEKTLETKIFIKEVSRHYWNGSVTKDNLIF